SEPSPSPRQPAQEAHREAGAITHHTSPLQIPAPGRHPSHSSPMRTGTGTGSSPIPGAATISTKLPRRRSTRPWRQSERAQCCTTTTPTRRRRAAPPPPCPLPTSPAAEAAPAPRPASPPRTWTYPSSSSTTPPSSCRRTPVVAVRSAQAALGARRRRSGRARTGSRSGRGRRSRSWTTATSGGSTARSPSRTAPTQ
ncbi:hypothetical protein ACJX0J_035009, partial [Zea mays]